MKRIPTRHEHGSTLVEVLIAIVILGVVGAVLLNGLLVNRSTSDKVAVNAAAFSQVDAASQLINASTFRPCNILQANPYDSISLPSRVSIVSVEGMTRAGAWTACGAPAWSNQRSIMQRIVIRAPYTNNAGGSPNTGAGAKYVTRTLFKSFPGGTYAANYSVKLGTPGGPSSNYDLPMGPIPGPGQTSSAITLTVQNQSQSCFEVLDADYTTASTLNPVITNPCGTSGATTTLQVTLPAATTVAAAAVKPGSYIIDIGAYNYNNGDVAAPASLRVIVKPSLQVALQVFNGTKTLSPPSTTETLSSTAACTGFKTTTAVSNAKYCLLKFTVVPGTGSTGGIELSLASGCKVKAAYGTTTVVNTYVRCSFYPPFSQTTQLVWGSETSSVDLYLWKESDSSQTIAFGFCNGSSTSQTNKANQLTIELYDHGLSSPYKTLITLPPISVTC